LLIKNFIIGLVRFVPKSDSSKILVGQPVDEDQDVGKALREDDKVEAYFYTGTSVLDYGTLTDKVESIERVLSPIIQEEVGMIRCVGLNVC